MFTSVRGQSPQGRPEVRIDPEDGQPRTLEELKVLCADKYTDAQILEYWNEQCVLHESEAIHNVANDPFLTHAPQAPRPPQGPPTSTQPPSASTPPAGTPQPASSTMGPSAPDGANTREDPFMTHGTSQQSPSGPGSIPGYDDQPRARRQQQLASAKATVQHWTESLYKFLGPGDPARDPSTTYIHIVGPWLVFVWILLLWLLLRHYSPHASVILTAGLWICFAGMIFVWTQGRLGGTVPYLALGTLCLFATLAGMGAGLIGWDQYWRQYWWTQTGYHEGATSASTPAGARNDFAIVNFWDDATGSTVNGTQVDHLKSAGYKDEHYYCAAPILGPETAGVSLVLVNYWAIGMDCCQQLGSFTCDSARESGGGYGVVMLEGGLPCPSCNTEQFRRAVTKAEAMHGLVSANDAVFVRWVANPTSVQFGLLGKAVLFIVVTSILALGIFAVLGWLTWYYGVGKLPPSAGFHDIGLLTFQKQM